MKVPATRSTQANKSAPAAAKKSVGAAKSGGSARAVVAAKKPVKAPVVKSVAKTSSKVVAKAPTASKVAAPKSAAKSAPKKSVAATPIKKALPAKSPTKGAKQAVVKAPASTATKKPMTPTTSPTKSTLPAKSKTAPVAAKGAGATSAASAASTPVPKAPKPTARAIVVEPTPRPMGKRAAKKVMMEQMTQAEVVPTHAPDAAKATFSNMNERLMSPPVPSSIHKDPKRANNWKSLSVEQLTDQDVQAMPDSEYMNEVQLAFFRRKLSLLKADMLANAGETTEHLREDTVVVPDPADRATIEEEHALELRTRDRERKLLKKIGQAIARIDSGEYGYCDETGEPIGVGRLMARPTANLSLEAQQRRELKQKMFGD